MLITGFLLLLVIGFWVVGARNRLMRLRQDVAATLPPLTLQLRKRHVLARHWSQSLHKTDAALAPAIEAVLVAESEAAGALNAVQTRAIGTAEQMRRLGAAEEALAAALAALTDAVRAPAEGVAETTASVEPAASPGDELRRRLEQLHPPLDYARQAYNAAVQTHNAALRVFPTTLVASTLRLQPAVMLPRLSKAG